MKKIFALLMAAVLTAGMLFSCGEKKEEVTVADDDFKLGVILLHDEASTYDLNFIEAVNRAAEALGLTEAQVIMRKNIPEGNECYEAAADLVDLGCDVIFADSFGHEDYMIKAAKEFKDVEFCHATGTKAHTENLPNFHNAFASIYEGRYLAGVAAGMKLNEMMAADETIVPKMGYVGAFTYAEVMSGYTSFYLGAKSVCPAVTMEVQFTGSWYDENEEKNAAIALMNNGCVLISQHADSMGAPSACEERNVPNVSYNGSTVAACPNTFIVSSKIDWTPYVKLICESKMNNVAIPADWTGTIETGSVVLTDVNTKAAAAGTVEKVAEVRAKLISGETKVYDTATEGFITVGGEALTSYMADVDTDAEFKGDTEVVKDGYFHESEYRSAPYFDVQIDGITLLNAKY
ncbi:MAG: BMP family ABC transporter substrate-binding protein [Clostridia bacterium]|nr:BMP family ABC transporter substrate-binding protein [Clostridia bacterium]